MSDARSIHVVHGLDLSYFTGKLEAYLRAKGIAYRLEEMTTGSFRELARKTGVAQMPQVETPDGEWLTDTPRIIDRLESTHARPSITPRDPVARFIAQFLEDYGDEHLWRPALYYRWAFEDDSRLMSRRLARGMMRDVRAPMFLRRRIILERQKQRYLRQDGVTAASAPAIEALYLETLAALEAALARRDFLMGDRPTRADFGFFGSMFRHFASDPTPAHIMRARAPRTAAWVARLWALEPRAFADAPEPAGPPEGLEPIARRIETDFLPYLAANAAAFARGARSVRFASGGAPFETPTNPYRVARFAELGLRWRALDPAARAACGAWLGASAGVILDQAPPPPPRAPGVHDREWRPM
jgi:glutathione S-transferase